MIEFGSIAYDQSLMELDWDIPMGAETPMPYVDYSDYIPANEWYADGEAERNISHELRTKQVSPTVIARDPMLLMNSC